MHEDMHPLLNAYLDGELQGNRLQEFKIHLASCETCRDELYELGLISDLLHAAPSPEFMPADRFASSLALQLPRRTQHALPTIFSRKAWWLVPVGLLTVWFFVQTVFTLTNLVTAASTIGLLGQFGRWFGSGNVTAWFVAVTSLFGGQVNGMQSTLSWLNELNIFGVSWLEGFLWQALIVLLYWGWLFVWLRHQHKKSGIS